MSADQTVEQRVIVSVRKILVADSILYPIFQTNVYASHISSITKPIYPAISLHQLSSSGAKFAEMGMVDVNLQIDAWFPKEQYNNSVIQSVQARFRVLLHRQTITDKTIPISGAGEEKNIGQLLDEDDTKLLHLPVIYMFRAF